MIDTDLIMWVGLVGFVFLIGGTLFVTLAETIPFFKKKKSSKRAVLWIGITMFILAGLSGLLSAWLLFIEIKDFDDWNKRGGGAVYRR